MQDPVPRLCPFLRGARKWRQNANSSTVAAHVFHFAIQIQLTGAASLDAVSRYAYSIFLGIMITITEELLESLLYEEEGPALDFKECQYPFADEDDVVKSELLKDILAFANAWRRTDAYILIGVEEVRGGRSIVRGVSSHLNDSDLQQFVCGKTNRPLEFSYQVHQLDGKQIGVIAIPLQERPFYVHKRFGKVGAREVLVRRGSSTDVATPDEISRMGAVQVAETARPELLLCFVDVESREELGTNVEIEVVNLDLPDEGSIPDYGTSGIGPFGSIPRPFANRDFYRDLAKYLDHRSSVCEIPLLVANVGSVPAIDIALRARIDDPLSLVRLLDERDREEQPTTSWYPGIVSMPFSHAQERYRIERTGDSWALERIIGKVQPKAQLIIRGLLLGASGDTDITIAVKLFADNLPDPVTQDLHVSVKTSREPVTLDELLSFRDVRD